MGPMQSAALVRSFEQGMCENQGAAKTGGAMRQPHQCMGCGNVAPTSAMVLWMCVPLSRAQVRQERAAAAEAERARWRGADFDEEPVPPPVASVGIPNSTAEALFHRLSADWRMVGNADQARLKEPRCACHVYLRRGQHAGPAESHTSQHAVAPRRRSLGCRTCFAMRTY